MNIIEKIEELQGMSSSYNFLNKLHLTKEEKEFLDLDLNIPIIYYEKMKARQSGKTYSLLLKAIELGLNDKNKICFFSRTINSSYHAFYNFIEMLKENNLYDEVDIEKKLNIKLKNGTEIIFNTLNANSIRGKRLDYALVDDWDRNRRESRYIEDCIMSTLIANNGQAFFMCIE